MARRACLAKLPVRARSAAPAPAARPARQGQVVPQLRWNRRAV